MVFPSLVPRPPRPAFVACSTKSGGRPGQTYHVMHAAADVMLSLLTSVLVLSPSLFFPWIQFVLSVQFVLRVRLLLDRSWLATVRDISRGTHHVINPSRPSPAFRTASDKSWAWRHGNEATHLYIQLVTKPYTYGSSCSKLHVQLHSVILSTFVIKLLRQC